TNCNKYYEFLGYQVFQLKDATVSVTDIHDPELAREVFQCDVKDGVTQLVNFTWSDALHANVPMEMVNGSNKGIQHTLRITEDVFATGDKRLINNKSYYFVAIAYGFNMFKKYDQLNGDNIDGQKEPYKAGRKSVAGSIQSIEVRPHKYEPRNNGTVLHCQYGDGVEVTRLEGLGTGDNYLKLTQVTHDEIMAGPPWKTQYPKYQPKYGPVNIKIVDPLNVVEDEFIIRFDTTENNMIFTNGFIKKGKWCIYKASEEAQIVRDSTGDIITFPSSTIWSDSTFLFNNEQLILEYGFTIKFVQVDIPMKKSYLDTIRDAKPVNDYIENNGFIGANFYFSDSSNYWLFSLPDDDDCSAFDWIRAGTTKDDNEPKCNDYPMTVMDVSGYPDEFEIYEDILSGMWGPFVLCSKDYYGHSHQFYGIGYSDAISGIFSDFTKYRIPGVDIYITKDRNKWTRCPVIEMCENDTTDAPDDHKEIPGPSQGNTYKFAMRRAPSIDKDGNFADTTQPGNLSNTEAPNYIFSRGMGWFPGYAIDVETGHRLNMACYGILHKILLMDLEILSWAESM
ncbi:MAG: hypothetical protein HY738_03695, partial [Bacteroidia bacterium]|nr:hypothetical protein [Bacteroidia bacterium]